MKKNTAFICLLCLSFGSLWAQDTIIPLWPDGNIPNRIPSDEKEVIAEENIVRISKVQYPTLEVYLPSKSNNLGTGVLIFPGGGYHILAYDWEGTDIAKWFNSQGIAAFVVKYRLPTSASLEQAHEVPLIDAQRAIRLVRNHSEDWQVQTDKIGIMGFSAGGHLASTLGTHYGESVYDPVDETDQESARPDFMILMYPVISFTAFETHQGSKQALIGDNPDPEKVRHFSNELQVTSDTPPAILIHAADDKAVPPKNSILFFEALRKQGVSATLHIYPSGGHGFSLATKNPYLHGWTDRVIEWLGTLD